MDEEVPEFISKKKEPYEKLYYFICDIFHFTITCTLF